MTKKPCTGADNSRWKPPSLVQRMDATSTRLHRSLCNAARSSGGRTLHLKALAKTSDVISMHTPLQDALGTGSTRRLNVPHAATEGTTESAPGLRERSAATSV